MSVIHVAKVGEHITKNIDTGVLYKVSYYDYIIPAVGTNRTFITSKIDMILRPFFVIKDYVMSVDTIEREIVHLATYQCQISPIAHCPLCGSDLYIHEGEDSSAICLNMSCATDISVLDLLDKICPINSSTIRDLVNKDVAMFSYSFPAFLDALHAHFNSSDLMMGYHYKSILGHIETLCSMTLQSFINKCSIVELPMDSLWWIEKYNDSVSNAYFNRNDTHPLIVLMIQSNEELIKKILAFRMIYR